MQAAPLPSPRRPRRRPEAPIPARGAAGFWPCGVRARRIDIRCALCATVRLLFVDDSGSPTPPRARWDSGLYILVGVAVDDRNLPSVAKAAGDAKAAAGARLGLGEWEAHAYDVWNNRGRFASREGMLTVQQKREIFSRMIDAIASPQLGIIPVVVNKLSHGRQRPRRRPLAVGWAAMFNRFERMLDRSREESGLILADAGSRDDEKAARSIVERMGRARMEREPNRAGVMNGVIFRDSRLDIMIQLADTAAYVVHKHYRKNAHFRSWFEAIRPKFDEEPTMATLEAGDGYA